ncbi:MAG: DUF4390 domain-containing protein [Burkholderiales bacterium]|nr:DUF4390 domain-containing protein [Burkholderiales bacterium]
MRFSKKNEYKLLLLFLTALLTCFSVQAEGIRVKSAEFSVNDDYRLNAYFEIHLNPTLDEALKKGVPLNFLTEFELTRVRWYWLDEKIIDASWHTKLSYNALTQQYRLNSGTLYQNFDNLSDAVSVMGSLLHRQVINKSALKKGADYVGRLRMSLDISLLPKPFQIDALASNEWNLDTNWFQWDFVP